LCIYHQEQKQLLHACNCIQSERCFKSVLQNLEFLNEKTSQFSSKFLSGNTENALPRLPKRTSFQGQHAIQSSGEAAMATGHAMLKHRRLNKNISKGLN
jgi:hypothetical protein